LLCQVHGLSGLCGIRSVRRSSRKDEDEHARSTLSSSSDDARGPRGRLGFGPMSLGADITDSSKAAAGLSTWCDGGTKEAILDFVERVSGNGPDAVPPEERIAVFDNDGTLWCEKPMPIQLDFILRRLVDMAGPDPGLRPPQPRRAP